MVASNANSNDGITPAQARMMSPHRLLCMTPTWDSLEQLFLDLQNRRFSKRVWHSKFAPLFRSVAQRTWSRRRRLWRISDWV